MDIDHEEIILTLKGSRRFKVFFENHVKDRQLASSIYFELIKKINQDKIKNHPLTFNLNKEYSKDGKEHKFILEHDDWEYLYE